jgi:outer membrane lipoprotein-sorting protein
VIGQAPLVATNVFDMVSNGETFRVYIPSKNTFLEGSTTLATSSKKPLENLRPQHIVEALFWPEISASAPVLFEQFNEDPYRYYILTLLRPGSGGKPEIDRKIWFDRSDLRVSRIWIYGAGGVLNSEIDYATWQLPDPSSTPATPAASATTGPTVSANTQYPRDIRIWRPQDDYRLEIQIMKLTINEPIAPDRFELPQPPGSELVALPETAKAAKP